MADCDIPVGLTIPGPDEVSACEPPPPPPCPTPPLPEKAAASGPTPICYPDGTMVYAVASSTQPINTACPVIPGSDPEWVGYWDQTGAWSAGSPPAGWVPCGAKSDVELAGRVCLVNTDTGEYAGSLFVEATYDNSVTPPVSTGYVLAALLPDGTWQRPFVPAANLKQEPCPSASPIAIEMHECVDGDCVMFVRWYNPVLGTVIFDRNLDGTPYTVNDPTMVQVGYCLPPTTPVAEIMHECVSGTCVEFVRWYCASDGSILFNRGLNGLDYLIADPLNVQAGPCPQPDRSVEFVHVCTGESCTTYERVKTINACTGAVTIVDLNLDGTPVATPLNPLFTQAGPCQTDSCVECTEVFTREPWHVEVVAGEEVAVDFTLTDYTLPEPVANAVAGTTNPNPATTPGRYFAPSIYDGALASGGTWTEPGVQGGTVTYASQWYGYVGPVSNVQPALWPYAALRVNATVNPDCAPPPAFDVETSFQWRYDGPHLPPLAAPAQVGDMGIFAWLIDVSGPTVVATTSVTELSITAIGQTGVVTFNTSGLTLAQVNNLAVIIAVNPVEGGNDGDFTLPSGSTYLKNTGYTVSQLSLNVTGTAQCPECRLVFREDTCAGERWKDDNGNLITKPAGAVPGFPAADTIVVEVVGYNDPAGCRTIEIVKTIDGCTSAVTVAGHELDGTPIVGFDAALIVAECPCPPTIQLGVITDWSALTP